MNENVIKQCLDQLNFTLSNGLKNSIRDILIPILTTLVSVIVGAALGTWLTRESERKRMIIENHRKFFEDLHAYFVKVHSLVQEIHSYNHLLIICGFPDLIYDYYKPHPQNISNLKKAKDEYNNHKDRGQANEQISRYWELINNTIEKLYNYNLIIDLASSMNSTAQVSSMFVSKEVKKAFDSLILKTQEMSKDNFKTFNLGKYKETVLSVLQLAKNEIALYKGPLFYEQQNSEFQKGENVRLTLFANVFEIEEIKEDKVVLLNSKGEKYIVAKDDIESL